MLMIIARINKLDNDLATAAAAALPHRYLWWAVGIRVCRPKTVLKFIRPPEKGLLSRARAIKVGKAQY